MRRVRIGSNQRSIFKEPVEAMFKVDDGANEVVVVGAERLASHCVETFAGKPVDICRYVWRYMEWEKEEMAKRIPGGQEEESARGHICETLFSERPSQYLREQIISSHNLDPVLLVSGPLGTEE